MYNDEKDECRRVHIGVSYDDKDKAKKLGAKWDIDNKSWYILGSYTAFLLKMGKKLVNVPYEDKDKAKKLGAKWDNIAKIWYINVNEDEEEFITNLTGRSSALRKIDKLRVIKDDLCDSLSRNNNADITIFSQDREDRTNKELKEAYKNLEEAEEQYLKENKN